MRGKGKGRAASLSWERLDVVAPDPGPAKRGRGRGAPLTVGETRRRAEARLSPDAQRLIGNMAAYGFSLRQIMDAAGVTKAQLRFCKQSLVGAALRKDAAVIDSAFLQATGGGERGKWTMADGAMTRFWLTHRLGWKPPPERKVALSASIDLGRLSDDQLSQLELLLEAASGEAVSPDGDGGGVGAERAGPGGAAT